MHLFTPARIGAAAGVLLAGAAPAEVIEVPSDDAPTIQIGINIAADGDEIVVAPGTYFESLDLLGKAVTLHSSDGRDVTTIDGLGQFDSVIHAVSGEGPDTVIEGFTITRGNADGVAGPDDRGGGLFVDGSSPTVADCTFTDNFATNTGGGVYSNAGSPTFTNCRFELNSAAHGGGAYFNNSTVELAGCEFDGNEALDAEGGAIRIFTGGYTITDSVFTNNVGTTFGGAISIRHATAGAVITRSRFLDNFCGDGGSEGRGGAVYSSDDSATTIADCLFVDNAADQFGGALYGGFPMTVASCSITGSSAGGGSNAVLAGNTATAVVNCVVWGNAGNAPVNGAAVVTYSNVQGGFAGTGNIAADPMFSDLPGRDLTLQAGSPCIDAGDTEALDGPYPVDLDGALRAVNDPDSPDSGNPFLNLAVDMGAYEFQPAGGTPGCPADLDGSGDVGTPDFLELLATWGPCP